MFDAGSTANVIAGMHPDEPSAVAFVRNIDMPVDFDIAGSSARFVATYCQPLCDAGFDMLTYTGNELYSSRSQRNDETRKKFTLYMHVNPKRYRNRPAQLRALWPGPPVGWPSRWASEDPYGQGWVQYPPYVNTTMTHQGFAVWRLGGEVRENWSPGPAQGRFELP